MYGWRRYLFLLLFIAAPVRGQGPATQPAAVIELHGDIDDYNKSILIQNFSAAREQHVSTVILKLNTYGGLVTAGLDISRFLKQQNDLHVIAFVDEKAISAGAMIALACDEIVMQPHALLGDCAPITLSSSGELATLGATERAKMESPIIEDFRDSARRNHYPEQLVLAMVSTSRVVHYVQNDKGVRRFVDEAGYQEALKDGGSLVAGVRDPLNAQGALLTVGADLAQTLGLIKEIKPSVQALADARGLNIVTTLSPGFGDDVVRVLGSTALRGILTTIFLFALFTSFSHPGHGMAEVLAAVTLAVLIGVPLLTGYAQWWEILAVLAGIVLLAFEIFVIPGFGIAGISGIMLVLIGLTMTFVGHEPDSIPGYLPQLRGTWDSLQRGVYIMVGGLFCSMVLWIWLQRSLPRLPYFNRLILNRGTRGALNIATIDDPLAPRAWPQPGTVGVALSDLRPGGSAAFHDTALNDGRRTDVVSESGFVPAGAQLIVREVSGNRVVVRATTGNA